MTGNNVERFERPLKKNAIETLGLKKIQIKTIVLSSLMIFIIQCNHNYIIMVYNNNLQSNINSSKKVKTTSEKGCTTIWT